MEVASSVRPLPHFDYVPTTGCEPSHRHTPYRVDAQRSRRPNSGRPAKSTVTWTPYTTHSRHAAWFEKHEKTLRPWGKVSRRRCTPEHRSTRKRTRSPPSGDVFSSRLTMEVLASYKETSKQPESTTFSVFNHWWNKWQSVDPQDLYLRTRSHGPCLLFLSGFG
ncbi:hypothetical protein Cgig2_010638 [Carnegiea gigantea]|uniref:Uncharacterized protein n=1 Tax=Carnegiea gigantea TaxID=171969 RepID=A0A9Q1JKJ0_9CARY|nr:hypothetical protein Cgig2_010638 [Carnegiea gigantea]